MALDISSLDSFINEFNIDNKILVFDVDGTLYKGNLDDYGEKSIPRFLRSIACGRLWNYLSRFRYFGLTKKNSRAICLKAMASSPVIERIKLLANSNTIILVSALPSYCVKDIGDLIGATHTFGSKVRFGIIVEDLYDNKSAAYNIIDKEISKIDVVVSDRYEDSHDAALFLKCDD